MPRPIPIFPLMLSIVNWTEFEFYEKNVSSGIFAVVFPRHTENEIIVSFMSGGKVLKPIDEFSQHMFVGSSYRTIEGKLKTVFETAKDYSLWNNPLSDFTTSIIRVTDGEGNVIGDIQTIRGFCQAFSDFL